DLIERLAGRAYDLGGSGILIGQSSVARAAVKYGRAVAHLRHMTRHLQSSLGARSFDLELSVAEGELETSVSEHIYLGSEIRRLGIPLASLALRFVGRFEEAVDYIGSLEEFAESFQKHVAVARMFGPYKLSLHAGSDK